MHVLARHIVRIGMLACSMPALSGCALSDPVQAWEKGTLARPEMTFKANSLDVKYSEHIYSSREAASGGAAVGGGGCGCN
jgi:hypothetical protein